MEDSYQCVQDLRLHPKVPVSYYAVFDGHGGYQCAQFLRDNLHLCLTEAFLSRNQKNATAKKTAASDFNMQNSNGFLLDSDNLAVALAESIEEAFEKADSIF